MSISWGTILMAPGFSGETITLQNEQCKVAIAIVGTDDIDYKKTQEIARQFFDENFQMIELTSQFGVLGTSAVMAVVDSDICPTVASFIQPESEIKNTTSWSYFFQSPGFSAKTTLKSMQSEVTIIGNSEGLKGGIGCQRIYKLGHSFHHLPIGGNYFSSYNAFV